MNGLVLISFSVSSLELVVCGDVLGNMWFIQPSDSSTWSNRKHVSSDRVEYNI